MAIGALLALASGAIYAGALFTVLRLWFNPDFLLSYPLLTVAVSFLLSKILKNRTGRQLVGTFAIVIPIMIIGAIFLFMIFSAVAAGIAGESVLDH